jgi:hypothetical protein
LISPLGQGLGLAFLLSYRESLTGVDFTSRGRPVFTTHRRPV